MSFDERALLREQELWLPHAGRRLRWRDGPLWWLGPLPVFAATGALLPKWPAPEARPHEEAREAASSQEESVVASASASLTRRN